MKEWIKEFFKAIFFLIGVVFIFIAIGFGIGHGFKKAVDAGVYVISLSEVEQNND